MPKKDTKKKTTKPKVLKQKQKQKQTQNVTVNINTKAPRKSAPKKQQSKPQVINTYPVFMQMEPLPPVNFNLPIPRQEIPKMEQTEPVKIFVSPKIETEPVKVQPTIPVPDVTPITVQPKKERKRAPLRGPIFRVPYQESSTPESSPTRPVSYPKSYPKTTPVPAISNASDGYTDPTYSDSYDSNSIVPYIENPLKKKIKKTQTQQKMDAFFKGDIKIPKTLTPEQIRKLQIKKDNIDRNSLGLLPVKIPNVDKAIRADKKQKSKKSPVIQTV